MNANHNKFYSPGQYVLEKEELGESLVAAEMGLTGVKYYLALMEEYPVSYNSVFPVESWQNVLKKFVFPVCTKETIELIKPYIQGRLLRDLPHIFAIISEDKNLKQAVETGLERIVKSKNGVKR